MEVRIRTLTPIWTGDVERRCSKIKETGIIGSLRWWYEALVRGLGGYACDPASERRCELDQKRFQRSIKGGKSVQKALDEQICPACQLFGCTGWSRRFRFEIDGVKENDIDVGKGSTSGLKQNKTMLWKFSFIRNLRNLNNEQKWLFKKTLWIVEDYGFVGGRTTWKPNGSWSTDYGLIKVEDYGEIKEWDIFSNKNEVKSWLDENKMKLGKNNKREWFNFRYYWIVDGKYLNREQMNRLVKRDPKTGEYTEEACEFDRWLGGKRGVTKKIFSFKSSKKAKKVFGYVREQSEIEEIRERLKEILGSPLNFKTGEEILEV